MPWETRIPQVFLQALITLIVIIILFINNNHIYTAKNLITHCKHSGMKQTINKMPKKLEGFLGYHLLVYHLVVNIATPFIQTGARNWLRLMQSKLSDLFVLDKEAQTANKVAGI